MTWNVTGIEIGRISHALCDTAQDLVTSASEVARDARLTRETATLACDASRLACDRSVEIRAARSKPALSRSAG